MNLIEWAKSISLLKNAYTKTGELINLGFFISESEQISKNNQEDVKKVVEILLESVFYEQDDSLRLDIFNTIADIVYGPYMDILDIDWEPLGARISTMNKDDLSFALLLLGYSRKAEYLPLIESYMTYPDPFIQSQAIDAISEIQYTLTNKDPEVKEWVKEKKKKVREQYPDAQIPD